MITVRRAEERGRTKLGWLDSRHTFSFGRYFDPHHVKFGPLRVINDDVIEPGGGFGTHPHDNMEIVTWPVEGGVEHRDSTGGGGVIRHGDVQVMSAGTGLTHSEFNASQSECGRLIQVWIEPAVRDAEPRYADRSVGLDALRGALVPIASGDGRGGSLEIRQDAAVYAGVAQNGSTLTHELEGRRAWVQVVRGRVEVNGVTLNEGDGAAVSDEAALSISAPGGEGEVLVFDLPGRD